MKKELILAGKVVALCCTVAGLFFSINGQWHESSIAWNATAAVLWLCSLA
ncbi:MAG: hypothetical protein UU48_C0006G0015 [Candidatus Uhrbacteria bacterium GW2011_GWF2_41_16]|uniref:Uncharacterized protein n=2 Tax=Candidatus Uhriibacteriota TaxID=1752732 RepID=A0A0G0XMF8_9BACT|nr:MAG: hypothetical protein UU35_C0015G0008 [Candidatus Uhrbacteria bacterium GW2011_GWC2_41_11]KKR97975.1 MAG: hypothetical protein UU48_C0006G0015 [Candidatus Uhrbacteria bacterium GW2011_GWF2_41_16]